MAGRHSPGRERGRALRLLAGFRGELYRCFSKRPDALFELADAVLCKPERVHMIAELSLEPECRRGHGGVYDALNAGQVQIARLRRALAVLRLPAWDDGRIRLAVDVSNWLRPDAETSPQRLFCHCYARGKGSAQMIPGWPYSLVAALEPGRTSDAAAGGILIVFDSGYDLTRLAWLLEDLPVEIMGRLRSDRVMYLPAPPRPARPAGTGGRPPRHGAALKLADPRTWPAPAVTTVTETTRYGTAAAMAWGRLHQRLAGRAGWEDHDGELPVIEGTLIRLAVGYLPGDRSPDPLWLWSSHAGTTAAEADRTWQAFLRRFDLEHTFRFLKQVPGWTRPKLRDPAAADRWTWLIIACYAQLRLARHLAEDLRLPWQRPCLPARPADPRPHPPRVPEHPPDAARPGQRAETRQTRPRPPARLDEPPARHPPRRRQDRQKRDNQERPSQAEGLNAKLRDDSAHAPAQSVQQFAGHQGRGVPGGVAQSHQPRPPAHV